MADRTLPATVDGDLVVAVPAVRARWFYDLLERVAWQELRAGRPVGPEVEGEIEVFRVAAAVHELGCRVNATDLRRLDGDGAVWLSTGECASRMGLTEGAVRKRVERGRLPGASKVNGQWRIPVEAMIDEKDDDDG